MGGLHARPLVRLGQRGNFTSLFHNADCGDTMDAAYGSLSGHSYSTADVARELHAANWRQGRIADDSAFDRLDRDGDGRITREEWNASLKASGARGGSPTVLYSPENVSTGVYSISPRSIQGAYAAYGGEQGRAVTYGAEGNSVVYGAEQGSTLAPRTSQYSYSYVAPAQAVQYLPQEALMSAMAIPAAALRTMPVPAGASVSYGASGIMGVGGVGFGGAGPGGPGGAGAPGGPGGAGVPGALGGAGGPFGPGGAGGMTPQPHGLAPAGSGLPPGSTILGPGGVPVGAGGAPIGVGGVPLGAGGVPVGPGGVPLGGSLGPGGVPLGASIGPGGVPLGGSLGPGGVPFGASIGPGGVPLGPGGVPLGAGGVPLGSMIGPGGVPIGASGTAPVGMYGPTGQPGFPGQPGVITQPGGELPHGRPVAEFEGPPHLVSENIAELPPKYVQGMQQQYMVNKLYEKPITRIEERERQVKKPSIIERVIEVPKPEIREITRQMPPTIKHEEQIQEVEKVVIEERVVHRVKKVQQERLIEVPKVEYVERIEYEDLIEYREVPVDKIVEVPEIEYRIKEVEHLVPQTFVQEYYVDNYQEVPVTQVQETAQWQHVPVFSEGQTGPAAAGLQMSQAQLQQGGYAMQQGGYPLQQGGYPLQQSPVANQFMQGTAPGAFAGQTGPAGMPGAWAGQTAPPPMPPAMKKSGHWEWVEDGATMVAPGASSSMPMKPAPLVAAN